MANAAEHAILWPMVGPVGLAWAFVGLRAVHSLIHVTYNRVVHRFFVYAASTLCVFAMWILFAVSLARESP